MRWLQPIQGEIEMNIRNEHLGGGVAPSQPDGDKTVGWPDRRQMGVARGWNQTRAEGRSHGNRSQIRSREWGQTGT